jgi:hypothetical protein
MLACGQHCVPPAYRYQWVLHPKRKPGGLLRRPAGHVDDKPDWYVATSLSGVGMTFRRLSWTAPDNKYGGYHAIVAVVAEGWLPAQFLDDTPLLQDLQANINL